MEKTKEEFVVWIRQAVQDRKSESFVELYQFLVQVFVRADRYLKGKVDIAYFDSMIEEAAALPRLHGFAPETSSLYSSAGARMTARAQMFRSMDDNGDSYITLDEWIDFALRHIQAKIHTLPKDFLGGSTEDVTKEEFIGFIKKAVVKGTPEYRELYFFLLNCFVEGDSDHSGSVDLSEFDAMIEIAAAAPRRFGLAPSSTAMFASNKARIAKRREYFTKMDVNGDGKISFDEWFKYAFDHIVGKAKWL